MGRYLPIFIVRFIPPILLVLIIPMLGTSRIIFGIYKFISGIIYPSLSSFKIHSKKVKYVQDQVLEWNRNGRKNKLCTARPGFMSMSWRTPIYKDTMTKININLNNIIHLDIRKQIIQVEPLVCMGDLSNYLLNMGWILPVVPELDSLTVGGLICGAGIETSSHKHGQFSETCIGYEIVLADGQVVNCSKHENSDLFYAIPMSHGTLGFLVSATIRIIPSKKYIRVEYIPVHSLDEAVSVFEAQSFRESGNEYVEGIMYSLDKGVIMVGNMAEESGTGNVNSIGRWYKLWFYKHVESFLKKPPTGQYIEYIPMRDYLHRHTKSMFWETEISLFFGNIIIFRYLFGWILPVEMSLIFLVFPDWFKSFLDDIHIVQDFPIPIGKLKESLIFTHEQTKVYPIWLCPMKNKNVPGMSLSKDEMYVDIGVYGMPKVETFNVEKTGRKFENFCLENRGYQALYADVFLAREEFETMYDHDLYFKMRKKLNCEDAFPEIYDKICRASRR